MVRVNNLYVLFLILCFFFRFVRFVTFRRVLDAEIGSNANGCDFENKRSNKYSLILCNCRCAYFSGIYHFHWKVVYCFSLGIQTHARDVVYMQ